jgi:hypothetical protein
MNNQVQDKSNSAVNNERGSNMSNDKGKAAYHATNQGFFKSAVKPDTFARSSVQIGGHRIQEAAAMASAATAKTFPAEFNRRALDAGRSVEATQAQDYQPSRGFGMAASAA